MSNSIPLGREGIKQFIKREIDKSSSENIEESLKQFLSANPEQLLTTHEVMQEILQEQKERFDEFACSQKKIWEQHLEDIFSKIPDSSLNNICATAEVFDSSLLGGVYFIRNEYSGAIKIGYASDIKERFGQLKASFLHVGMEPKLKLVCIILTYPKFMAKLEGQFHRMFKDCRKIGEWFEITIEDVCNEIFSCSDQWDVINDVVVDYTDYECEFFKNVPRSYVISDSEIKKMLSIPTERWLLFDIFDKPHNKLFLTARVIENNRVGFYDLYYSPKDEGNRKVGIRYPESDIAFDFQGLKRHKFNTTDWANIIKSINNN